MSCVPNLVKWLCAELCAELSEVAVCRVRRVSVTLKYCKLQRLLWFEIKPLVAVTDNPAFCLQTNYSFNETRNRRISKIEFRFC